jgi:hypothetical protein
MRMSLEDVFLQVTTDEAAGASAAEGSETVDTGVAGDE